MRTLISFSKGAVEYRLIQFSASAYRMIVIPTLHFALAENTLKLMNGMLDL